MATNSGDLVRTLIEGGLEAQAARAIANAIANAASPTFSQGRDISDATPTEQLRLITADTRRYQLTNLDFSPTAPFQDRLSTNPGQYAGAPADHPYKDSQPVTSAPPLSAPRVQASDYLQVDNDVDGNSAVSRVGLRLRKDTGRHLRIDPSTKFLDALPFVTSSETPRFLSAEYIEREDSTELVIALRNLEAATVELADGTTREVFVFPDAAATPSPYPPISARLRALVTFNATAITTVGGEQRASLTSAHNISKVLKVVDGAYDVYFGTQMPNTLYSVLVTAGDNDSGENPALLTLTSVDRSVNGVYNQNGFRVRFWTPTTVSVTTPINPYWATVAVFA
jgi:hypothetical protein